MSNTIVSDIEQVRAALDDAGYLHGHPSGDEQRMFCPICEDPDDSHSPSASINLDTGMWNCLKSDSEHGGSLISLHKAVAGKGVKLAPLSDGTVKAVSVSRPKPRVVARPVDATALLRIERAELRLWDEDRASEGHLRFLMDKRGLLPETITANRLGLEYSKRDEDWRILIPVILDGKVINVRRYKMNAEPGDKMRSLQGHGSGAMLFGADLLIEHPDAPVLLCESELDCILANQEAAQEDGTRLYVAVTGTGGAGNVPANLDLLAGREVYIGYDADEAGRKGASAVAKRLAELGTTAGVLDLTALGLDPESGQDITDLLIQHGTAYDLAEAFEHAHTQESRPRFVRVTAAQLAEPVPAMEWLVEDVWAEGGYGVYGGAKKTLKTYNLLALAIAVASGKPFLKHFGVPHARPVVMYLSEGGDKGTRRRLQQIAAWMGVELASIPLTLVFDSAPIGSAELTNAIRRECRELRPGLVILDALYAFHAHDIEVSNLYARGQMLRDLEQLVVAADRALIVADHFSKMRSKELDLDAISQSGVAEWAHSWALSKHRAPADVAAGEFKLAVQYGGRDGYGADYAIDWHLGSRGADGLHAGPVSADVSFLIGDGAEPMSAGDRITNALRDVMQRNPFEFTRDEIIKQVTGGNSARREAFNALEDSPGVEQRTVQREDSSGRSRSTVVWGASRRIPLGLATAANGGESPADAEEATYSAGDTPPDGAAVNGSEQADSEALGEPPLSPAANGGVSQPTPRDPSPRKGSVRRRKSGGERR